MKIFILTLCIIGLICFPGYASIRHIQDNHKVVYHIIDSDGDHVSGQTITVAIQKVSDGNWLDFDDSTFKASAWGNKTTNLSEDSTNGFYYYTFNPPASETTAEEYIFVVDNASATYGDHQSDIVAYQNIGTGTGTSTLTAANIWQTDLSGYSTANYAGTYLHDTTDTVATNLDTTVSSRGTSTLTTSDNIGINLADVSNPTTTLNLSGTTISTSQAVASVAGAVGSVTGGVTVTTNNDKTGYALSSAGIDSIWDEVQTGHATGSSFGLYLDSKVSEAGGGSLTVQDIVDGVWDDAIADHLDSGSTGKKLNEMPTPYDVGP